MSLSTHQAAPSSEMPETVAERLPSSNIQIAVRWMDANIASPISIDAVADAAAMSQRNFLRRFRKETGMTPSDYLLRARLNLCCRLLVETRLPVDKIARRCGFSGGAQLAKLFRKSLSTTPTAYREALKAPPVGKSSSGGT
ncbi:helix-turn-helix domain-containing protein [Paraburkholderia sabiae]|uniref:Helix-turn-helix domain-containing protein n=2 Tax=Paraburkholderia sabiae TaxID=273251 RepID=A0ABU9QSR9_9BURK|nr:helix-turn-helix domain-containing protein [Paraburkholderia sabiae]